jgi:hypothetical protein
MKECLPTGPCGAYPVANWRVYAGFRSGSTRLRRDKEEAAEPRCSRGVQPRCICAPHTRLRSGSLVLPMPAVAIVLFLDVHRKPCFLYARLVILLPATWSDGA